MLLLLFLVFMCDFCRISKKKEFSKLFALAELLCSFNQNCLVGITLRAEQESAECLLLEPAEHQ